MHATSPYRFGRPSRLQSQDKRNSLIEAAREVFSNKGFDAATTDEIASRAGLSKRTLYKWYPEKAALFSAAFAKSPKEASVLLLSEKGPPKRRVGSPKPPADGSEAIASAGTSPAKNPARRLPSLAQLASLDSLYRLGGFRAAAEEQRTSVAAISQRIRSLEADLGRNLLERSSEDKRRATFTSDGLALATFVHDWLETLYEHLGSRPRAGRLKRRR